MSGWVNYGKCTRCGCIFEGILLSEWNDHVWSCRGKLAEWFYCLLLLASLGFLILFALAINGVIP